MTEQELIQRTRKLTQGWDGIRIVGAGWAGDTRRGFQFNPLQAMTSAGEPGPPSITGACCIDGDCSVLTEANCVAAGGDYQGNGTDCDPNPCPQPPPGTGACCVGTDCTIETEDDCTGMGGTYQGDDTTCDPNPCTEPPPDCPCGFDAFDGSGRRFLTKTSVWILNASIPPFEEAVCDCESSSTAIEVETIDPVTCSSSTVFSGSWTEDTSGPEPPCTNGTTGGSYVSHFTFSPARAVCIFGAGCNDFGLFPIPDSATHASASCTYTDPGGSGVTSSSSANVTLSNECNPV